MISEGISERISGYILEQSPNNFVPLQEFWEKNSWGILEEITEEISERIEFFRNL